MNEPTQATQSVEQSHPWRNRLLAWLLLAVLTLIAYQSSYHVPLIIDDIDAIKESQSVRHWTTWAQAMTAREQSSFAGRPVVNLSFALQCGFDGKIVLWKLHAVNLLLHLFNVILLYELVCLVLRWVGKENLRRWALLCTAVWAIHPLNTEAVVYLTQRTELFVILFYMLTLYAALRYMDRRQWGWLWCAIAASALGMASKENMVSVPVMVLLMDRALASKGFGKAIKTHWKLYVGLCSTWLLLLVLNINGPRDASAGIHLNVTPWQYLLTQSKVICLYMQQVLTGTHLSVLHQIPIVRSVMNTLPQSVVSIALLAVTVYGLVKNRPLALAGAVFFLVLGPTSSAIPIVTEVAADRRMYLPSAAVLMVLFLLLGHWLSGRQTKVNKPVYAVLGVSLLSVCMWASLTRIAVYNSDLGLWESVLKFYPHQVEALNSLGYEYLTKQQYDKAMRIFERSVKLEDDYAEARDNLGLCYLQTGHPEEAVKHFRIAIKLDPGSAKAYNNLGIALARMGKVAEAHAAFTQALACYSALPAANLNMGLLEVKLRQYPQAFSHLERALPMLEGPQQLQCMLQMALAQLGLNHPQEAIKLLHQILQIQPNDAKAKRLLEQLQASGR